MRSPNKILINIFRGLLVLLLIINILNGAVSSNPRFSNVSSWGELWQGLFLTALITWVILEIANFYFKKTKVGHLPAYFWVIAAGLNSADFFNNYTLLFEIPNYDKFVHAFGGFFFGILMLGLAKRINYNYNLGLSTPLIYYLVFATVNMGGVVYEFAELIGDKYFQARNITGALDTSEDLVFNNIGVALLLMGDWVAKKFSAKGGSASGGKKIRSTSL